MLHRKSFKAKRRELRAVRRAIGKAIHQERRRQNLTLTQLGRKAVISPHLLDQYELGKREISFYSLARIAVGLDVEIRALLRE